MSLESAVVDLTAAITKLTDLLAQRPAAAAEGSAPPVKGRPRGVPASKPEPAAELGVENTQNAVAAEPARAPQAAAPASGPVSYESLRQAVLSLAEKKGHAVAVAVLAKFPNKTDGKPAKSAKELAEKDFASAIAACQAA